MTPNHVIYQRYLLSYNSGLRHWWNIRKKQFDLCWYCFSDLRNLLLNIITSSSKLVLDIRKFFNQSESMTPLLRNLSHQALVRPFSPNKFYTYFSFLREYFSSLEKKSLLIPILYDFLKVAWTFENNTFLELNITLIT